MATRAEVGFARVVTCDKKACIAALNQNVANMDAIQEAALLLLQDQDGANIVVPAGLQETLDMEPCPTDLSDITWPCRTVKVLFGADGVPGFVAGVLDNASMAARGIYNWFTGPNAVVCVLLHTSGPSPQAVQCTFSLQDLQNLADGTTTELPEFFESDDRSVMLMSVMRLLKVLRRVSDGRCMVVPAEGALPEPLIPGAVGITKVTDSLAHSMGSLPCDPPTKHVLILSKDA